ncbi:EAL domain-containing protein [Sulfurospirillum cavolei]|uniref:EAL domain-containing protein n=1 Tax=Sulfurospirillum cavolei TaxID=366522 RepID=UPI003FA252FD
MKLSLAWKWLIAALLIESVMLSILVYRNVEQLSDNLLRQTAQRLQAEKVLLQSALITPFVQNDYATVQAILEESYQNLNMLYLVALDLQHTPIASVGAVDLNALQTLQNTPLNAQSVQEPTYDTSIDLMISDQKIGSLRIGISTEFYQTERRSMMIKSIAIALVELLLSALILNLLARWINQNLIKLTQSAQAIAEGNYAKRVELSHDKEISKLATAFNAMAQSIQERIATLEQLHIKEQSLSKQLEYNAYYDVLTHLPNRVLLAERLHQALLKADQNGRMVGVIYLDLDGFKTVNDTYGHFTGDQLLVVVAQKMRHVMHENDTIARIGGDEFVIVLQSIDEAYACQIVLERLLKTLSAPVLLGDIKLSISCSIGVTLYPMDHHDAEQLIRHADQAMYIAKQSGKNRYHFFDFNENRLLKAMNDELSAIAQGLNRQEFVLYYQPKVNMQTGTIVGVEALIRWEHPQKGLLLPMSFIPLIEHHPLIVKLGEWVISQVLWQLREWNSQGLFLPVSINISAYQLQEETFLERLKILWEDYADILPNQLEIEILETSALEEIERVSHIIHECAAMGIHFALDDFGTGYSTLMHLKKLPAKILKMDKSFIADMVANPEDLTIVVGVIGLAKSSHKNIIAEGVESVEHGIFLLLQGCQYAQGYGIARPMNADQLVQWIADPQSMKDNLRIWRRYGYDSEALPWLYALCEHNAWINDLKNFIDNVKPTPPEISADLCYFGKWLHEKPFHAYREKALFRKFETLHKHLHRLAKELLEARMLESHELLRARIETIETLHQEMVKSIFLHIRQEIKRTLPKAS